MAKEKDVFTVDTHVFRELGELLVGRDSTALTELIKNSYDADATTVTVHAENLDDPRNGFIVVRDNGMGMSHDQFRTGFLRIASRGKEEGSRQSPRFLRRFTGAKGIGRLAAHKIAKIIEVISVSTDPKTGRRNGGFRAKIDWDLVEKAKVIDEIDPRAVEVSALSAKDDAPPGTTLTLRRLKRAWTQREIEDFVTQAQAMRPPEFLTDNRWVNKMVGAAPLIRNVRTCSTAENENQWDLQLTGMLAVGDPYFQSAANAAAWVLDVESRGQFVHAALAATSEYAAKIKDTAREPVKFKGPLLPAGLTPPAFQARILIREGDFAPTAEATKAWRKLASGIRVYQEGFRVLPYGDGGDDWLHLDRLYSKRGRGGALEVASLFEDSADDSYLSRLPNRGYLGGVFLTLDGAPNLRMLVNREGFLPEASFHFIQESIGSAIDYSTRERTAAKDDIRKKWHETRRAPSDSQRVAQIPQASARLAETIVSLTHLAKDARAAIASGEIAAARAPIAEMTRRLEVAADESGESREDEAMLNVLASLGSQTAAFVHETQGVLGAAESIERVLRSILDEERELSKGCRKQLQAMATTVREIRETLERQASYLTDVGTASARKRRSSQVFADRFSAATRLFQPVAATMGIEISNKIPGHLKSPSLFPAELVAVFSNLISNAIKAAGEGGRIRATGKETRDHLLIRVENTGIRVDPAKGEKWFKAFASSASDVDMGLGKGMGLGLTISRRMLQEYGATIGFAEPAAGFSTCLEIRFPN